MKKVYFVPRVDTQEVRLLNHICNPSDLIGNQNDHTGNDLGVAGRIYI